MLGHEGSIGGIQNMVIFITRDNKFVRLVCLLNAQSIFPYITYLIATGSNYYHFIENRGSYVTRPRSADQEVRPQFKKFNPNQYTPVGRTPSENLAIYKTLWEIQRSVSLPLRNLYLGETSCKQVKC